MKETTYSIGVKAEQPKDYKAEGEELIKKLMGSTRYCRDFFFDSEVIDKTGKSSKKVCQIAPLRSKMIFDLKRDYGVDVKPEDFSTIVYMTLWADGSWKPMTCYSGRSSFYAWLRKVAKNAVVEWLVEEHFLDDARFRSVGNTRLALLSQDTALCKFMIDDLMVGSKYHHLLTSIYVDRLPKEKIMKRLSMSDDEFETAKKVGENKLKDALLRSPEFSEADFLRDKKKRVVTVSSEVVDDLSKWCKTKMGTSPLSEVFGTGLSDEELSQKTVDFLYEFSEKLWNKDTAEKTYIQDRYIWRQRFVENALPVNVAQEVGHDRGWLDTRYSRLNKIFKTEIKKWWMAHAA